MIKVVIGLCCKNQEIQGEFKENRKLVIMSNTPLEPLNYLIYKFDINGRGYDI